MECEAKGGLEGKSRAEIRSRMKELRRELTKEAVEQKSRRIAVQVSDLPELKKARMVYLYLSYGREIDTLWLAGRLLELGKRVAVPRVLGPGQMEFFEIHGLADCKPGAYGILEPSETMQKVAPEPEEKTVMLLPGLAFDYAGGRMGYGGGYYDRYLERYPEIYKIALAYEFSILEKLPTEEHDIPVDVLVTENRVLVCRQELPQHCDKAES